VVAPSGPFDRLLFWRGLGWLSGYYRPHFDPTIFERAGFLAGTDARRRTEFQSAIDDPDATAIIVARGGWGAARFANSLDYTGLVANPKWIVGFSDPTILHMQAWKLGIASMHASNLVALGRADARARDEWLDALEFPRKHRVFKGRSIRPGQATGTLVGGNLTVLVAGLSAGNVHFPDHCILALEDVAESPYRIDRLMSALINSGTLDKIGGVALGQFIDCDSGPHGISTGQVLINNLLPLGIPIVSALPFGHGRFNSPMPFGTRATLDGNQGELHVGCRD
jgi:muramoyltetrapeptide carboxypeptidase